MEFHHRSCSSRTAQSNVAPAGLDLQRLAADGADRAAGTPRIFAWARTFAALTAATEMTTRALRLPEQQRVQPQPLRALARR